jgi:hypothetical protein
LLSPKSLNDPAMLTLPLSPLPLLLSPLLLLRHLPLSPLPPLLSLRMFSV